MADIAALQADCVVAETAKSEPEILAHHYTEAGLPEPATRYWLVASRIAFQRCAFTECIARSDSPLACVRSPWAQWICHNPKSKGNV